MVVKYRVRNGPCGVVNGRRSDDGNCVIKICGDGKPLRGTYCGRGPCDIAGCNCTGGCLRGQWEKSMLNNTEYRVEILEIEWQDLSLFRMPSKSIWEIGISIFNRK
ncbi:protein Diedel-like [Drosophila navojoa]|uniref:protein Diedel-like n=1 Tax=Drosophila navojoa TaxID=7232 RepID=UPI0011BE449E|nr:protein Diedel-like [Drosophila navojoa]